MVRHTSHTAAQSHWPCTYGISPNCQSPRLFNARSICQINVVHETNILCQQEELEKATSEYLMMRVPNSNIMHGTGDHSLRVVHGWAYPLFCIQYCSWHFIAYCVISRSHGRAVRIMKTVIPFCTLLVISWTVLYVACRFKFLAHLNWPLHSHCTVSETLACNGFDSHS